MNKVYLFVLVLLSASFTGCIDSEDLPVEEETDVEDDSSDLENESKYSTISRATEYDSLDDCPNGGVIIEYGIDENGSGNLEDTEVDGQHIVCHGRDGVDGEDGEDVNLSYVASLEALIIKLHSDSLNPPVPSSFLGYGIDSSNAKTLTSFQENSIARDSNGRLHVVFSGVYLGEWTPMYTSGNGSAWDTPTPIRTTSYSGVSMYYTPSIVIDSQDRLHVVFSDYGNIPASPEKVDAGFTYSGYGHVGYYARCDNYLSGIWKDPFTLEDGGGLLPATANRYQYYFDMDVDRNDNVYITWREDGSSRSTVAYKINSTGFTALPSLGDAYLSQNIVVDNNNKVLFVGGEYYNEHAMKIYELDASESTWFLRDKLIPRIRAGMSTENSSSILGENEGVLSHYRLSTTIDSDNYLHILAEVKDEGYNGKWRIMYYEFNSSASNSQDYNSGYTTKIGGSEGKLREVWVNPIELPIDNLYHPSISVDEGIEGSLPNVHVFWWRNALTPYVEYSKMVRGESEFGPSVKAIKSTSREYGAFKVLPQASISSNLSVIDIIVVMDGADLRYIPLNLNGVNNLTKCPLVTFGNCAGADLHGMNLSGLDLTGIDLRGADLSGADLSGTSLFFADLRGAELGGANLRNADIGYADFFGVHWHQTVCPDGVSSENKGDTCADTN